MTPRLQLTGIGLRSPHYTRFLTERPNVAWIEVHSENFFGDGGKPLHLLESLSHDYPISLHGVSLSLGSADELNWQHLKKLRDLIHRVNPCLVSDHLCWSSINGQYLHDLLPLPLTEEALTHVVQRIQQVQDYLGRQILIENVSGYIKYDSSTIPEAEFLASIAQQSGCGVLLDINNIYVNSVNFEFDPYHYINMIPAALVNEIHLGGYQEKTHHDKTILIDTHDQPVTNAVWDLYRYAITQFGIKPTMIEWDSNLPALEILLQEANRAEAIMRESYVLTKRAG